MPIVLQEPFRAVFYAPFYAALALGAYAEEGVEVRFVGAPRPDDHTRSVRDGAVDIGWGGPLRLMAAYQADPACDLVCFCEVVARDPFSLVGRAPRPGFVPADLAGLTLATVSEVPTPWLCLQHDLRLAGIDPSRLRLAGGRSMAQNAAALRRGDIDVAQLFEPFVQELVEDGAGHVWSAAAARGPTSYTALYARRATLRDRRDEARRMVRGMYRTQKWLHAADDARVAATVAPYFPSLPAARLAAAVARYRLTGIWGRDPRLGRVGYERLRDSLVAGGFVATGTPYEIAVDNALADEAVALAPPALLR